MADNTYTSIEKQQDDTAKDQGFKPIKIAMVCVGEMGHFIPMSQLAHALIQRGHEVHFVSNSDSFNGNKASKVLNEIGCKHQHFTDDGVKREDMFKQFKGLHDHPEAISYPVWIRYFRDELYTIRPDIVVCDFMTRLGAQIADDMQIPSVINTPGLLSFMDECGFSGIINYEKEATNCCGMVCVRQSLKNCCIKFSGNLIEKKYPEIMVGKNTYFKTWNTKRVVLINSFWGLDQAFSLPPNYIMTGPLSEPQGQLVQNLQTKDPELYKWLEDAQASNRKVVYISIGSMCKWEEWSVKAVYEGLKKVGCKVIWSLKDLKIPDENDPDFWVRPWIPQIEMMAHPSVVAGLSHCGFGGCLEYIAAGVPMIALPHFADQVPNAVEMVKRKVAVMLFNRGQKISMDPRDMYYLPKDSITPKMVEDTFNEVLNNEIYTHEIQKLQKIQQSTGGRDLAVKTIEDVAKVGFKHLIDYHMAEKHSKLNFCYECLMKLFLLAVFSTLVTFTVLYFVGVDK